MLDEERAKIRQQAWYWGEWSREFAMYVYGRYQRHIAVAKLSYAMCKLNQHNEIYWLVYQADRARLQMYERLYDRMCKWQCLLPKTIEIKGVH